jgi:hypothetical protein
MKQTLRQKIAMVGLLAFVPILGIAMDSADVLAQGPLQVTLTGTFLTMKDKGGLNAYVFSIRDKNWLFKVTNIEVPTATPGGASGWAILDEITPPRIWLLGDEKEIKRLRESNVLGKSFVLRGTLYVADGAMVITSAKEVSK